MAVHQGCFASPTGMQRAGSIHPGHAGLRAGRNHLLEAKFAWIRDLYFEERRGLGGIFSPPWGPRSPILVTGLDGERCQPGFTVMGLCKGKGEGFWWAAEALPRLPPCGKRSGEVTTSRVVPCGSMGRGATPAALRKTPPPSSPTWPGPDALEGVGLV